VRAFLDACVLVPAATREIVLAAAAEDLFQPLWSPGVLAEWSHAAARRDGPAGVAEAREALQRMSAAFPRALVPAPDPRLADSLPRLPDPQDAHVLAAAVAARADALISLNRRDFPRRMLAGLGLVLRDPDGLMWQFWSDRPDPVARAVALARARLPRSASASEGSATLAPVAGPRQTHPGRPPCDERAPQATDEGRRLRAFLRRAGMPRLGRAMLSAGLSDEPAD
jgi:predicted nucleic acid-binding protein